MNEIEMSTSSLPDPAGDGIVQLENVVVEPNDREPQTIPPSSERSQERESQIIEASLAVSDDREAQDVLTRMRAWHAWQMGDQRSLGSVILSKLGILRGPPRPERSEITDLIRLFFPSRWDLEIVACDIGPTRTETFKVPVERVSRVFAEKPTWATLRWIHVPTCSNPTARNVKYYFRNKVTTSGEEPTVKSRQCEVLNIRLREELQCPVDIVNMVANSWYIGRQDMPGELTEGIRTEFDDLDSQQEIQYNQQSISSNPACHNWLLVRDPLQCLSRSDGFLLTLSPMIGINFFTQIDLRTDYFYVERQVFKWFRQTWSAKVDDISTKDATWFLDDLFIKVQETPHSWFPGEAIPSIQDAYKPVVRQLKKQRGASFKRYESVNLVRQYVACMNELAQIYDIYEQKISALEALESELRHVTDAYGESTTDLSREVINRKRKRIAEAVQRVKKDHEDIPRMMKDLKESLDVLFQLRTIEQNELAIIAESNNKAILVFTIVTIVFLPLSFFTSYFGMNLQGIVQTERTERYFWAVCGTTTACIVGLTILFGFKSRLYAWAWEDRHPNRMARGRRLGRIEPQQDGERKEAWMTRLGWANN